MQIKIADRVIERYESIDVSLRYDATASTFAFSCYFDPANPNDRGLFTPGKYQIAEITNGNDTLITGMVLSHSFTSSSKKHLLNLGGYSKGGVFDDCQKPIDGTAIDFSSMSLLQIANKLCTPFGITVSADQSVQSIAEQPYTGSQTFNVDDTIKHILSSMAMQKNLVLAHRPDGNLYFTRVDTSRQPIFNFDGSIPTTSMELTVDGQQLHSTIWAVAEAIVGSANASQNSIVNPYVQSQLDWKENARLSTLSIPGVAYKTGFRPKVSIQTRGNDNDTPLTARQVLSQELKSAINLTIKLDRWTLNGTLVRPDTLITVKNPDLYLYQPTKWFIESVDFHGDSKEETAILHCKLPECYNNNTVLNVFTGTNLTVPVVETGAKAIITPFDQP